jgi:hypothetical protein
MRVVRVLSLAMIFLFYASFARAQEPKDVHNLQSGVFGVQGGAPPTSYTFTTIDYPGAVSTWVHDISGNNILGGYEDAKGKTPGFLYSISNSTYTTINVPDSFATHVYDISDNNIVGSYTDFKDNIHGFLYDISNSTYATIDVPGAVSTISMFISGNDIVGSYGDANRQIHGFLYDISNSTYTQFYVPGAIAILTMVLSENNILGSYTSANRQSQWFLYNISNSTYTTIDVPGAGLTQVSDISGNDIVGSYTGANGAFHGFLYDISNSTYTMFDVPGAVATSVYDISGNNILGLYDDAMGDLHGFLYNISKSTYTTIDAPGAFMTQPLGILGNDIVGSYEEDNGNEHGFLYNISKPTYTTFDVPDAISTSPMIISGNNILGVYEDASYNDHWFLTTIAGTKPPLIKSLSPTSGTIGTEVTIKGKYFGSAQGSVSFNGISVTSYTSWSDTSIECVVPMGASTGPVVVTTTVGSSNEKNFTVKPPLIKSLSPTSGTIGTPVTIKGKYFGPVQGSVSFNGISVTSYTSWSDTSIECIVPTDATTGPVVVTTAVGASNEKNFAVKPPQIKSLSPRSGTVETTVAIKGKYFGSARGSSTVSFNGTPVTNYTSWSDTTIKCTVPTGASTGPVVVTTTVGASNEKSFTVRP